jgi:hypothetical protein
MQMAPHMGTPYKHGDNMQPRGVSMVMSSDAGTVQYGVMPQLATLQIGSSVSDIYV